MAIPVVLVCWFKGECVCGMLLSGRRVMVKHSQVSTRATATLSGTRLRPPRHGRATDSRVARTGEATPAASISRSEASRWLPIRRRLWVVHSILTEDCCRLDLFLAVNARKFMFKTYNSNCEFLMQILRYLAVGDRAFPSI